VAQQATPKLTIVDVRESDLCDAADDEKCRSARI